MSLVYIVVVFWVGVGKIDGMLLSHVKFLVSDAFDTEELLSSMEKLRHGESVDIPKYDFKSYKNNVFPPRRVCQLEFSV